MLQAEQRWSNWDQLQAEQQGSVRSAAGGAAGVGYSIASRAVEVDCGAAVRQQSIGLAVRGISQQRSMAVRCQRQMVDSRRIGAIGG